VGLVSLEDFRKTKEDIEEEQRKLAAQTAAAKVCVNVQLSHLTLQL